MNNIYEEIIDSFKELDYKNIDDQDDLTEEVLNKSMCYLFHLLTLVGTNLPSLEINRCRNNSIDLSFRKHDKCRLLINISDKRVGWYGYCSDEDIKAENDNYVFVDNSLVEWITKYLI